ncbi:MAG: hypothetical protein A2754_02365 [Candidatus Magasanikbacteria bacterium RIFCSPHIGHO2_01_FULL_47_8]|uniref:Uncharacterized protein n=1 Tax=Candidatus Magasanikbacteria bacterium RIFCSPHIGHO2_01_FULL_47_8 TaxID=1798673 RepID=A0A1F6MCS6_9BACT|nr:MAG: hypothetical protein A2754_02365 [Candidatus Magasanikbacteria bacterium RIFCSPHIGHO2_01_FULL_47_8]
MLKRAYALMVIVIILIVSAPALAADYGLTDTGRAIGFGSGSDNIYALINQAVTVFLSMLAILFFILTLYAGLRWMTARGNEEMATKAKETLEAAVLGLAVVVLSYALVRFIFQSLGA